MTKTPNRIKTFIKYYYFPFFLLLFCFQIKALAHSSKAEIYQNQFEELFASDLSDTVKLQFCLDSLNNLSARGSDLPIKYAQKGIALAKQIKNAKWTGLLNVELGWIYQSLNQIKKAEQIYQEAIDLFSTANLLNDKSKALGKLSLLYGQTNRSDQALQQARAAIKISEQLGDEIGLAYAYYAIVYNFINAGKDREALAYIDKSIDLYQKNGEIYRVALLMENKVTSYIHLGEPEKALKAANELIQTINNAPIKYNATNRHYLGQALYSRAKVYMQLKLYKKALTDNDSLQVLLSNDGNSLVNAAYIYQKAKILYFTKDYRASKTLCLSLLQHPTVEAERFLGYTYEYLSKNCEALNQYKSAYKYHLEFEKYEEKEVSDQSKLKMEELQAKYEAEKTAAIILTQKQRLTQQRMIQWLAIGFAGIVGLLFFQSYRNAIARKHNNEALRFSNNQLGESNALLAEKNKENELLIKEIHHRVKNNLEIVSSLLELQAEQLTDVTTQMILQESQNRVQSMGLVHQKLYQKGILNSVEMRDYFKNLSESILETFNAWDRMDIDINMEKTILDVEVAIPIGLIVNELITNAWKYAFPEKTCKNKKGLVKVSLNKIDEQHLQLIVADNGIGKDLHAPNKGTGFGSQLINLLTIQLNGSMQEIQDNGTTFIFDFILKNKQKQLQ